MPLLSSSPGWTVKYIYITLQRKPTSRTVQPRLDDNSSMLLPHKKLLSMAIEAYMVARDKAMESTLHAIKPEEAFAMHALQEFMTCRDAR